MKINRFMAIMATALTIALSACGPKSETEPEIIDGGEKPVVNVDYSPLRTFVNDSYLKSDYLLTFTINDDNISIKTKRGKSISQERGSVPYIMANVAGKYMLNNEYTEFDAPADIRNKAPKLTVTPDGQIILGDVAFDAKAGKGLRCIVNARKHIYFYFDDKTIAVGSEIYTPYNPPLRIDEEQLDILFIGNSFTQDATQHVPALLTGAGISNVYMTRCYHGGYTLPEYLANFDQPNICAIRHSKPGYTAWDSDETQDDSPIDALNEREWDIIMIQEHTGRREAWEYPGTIKAAVTGLMEKFFEAQPNHRPTIVYLMSQTYSNNSSVLTTYFNNSREEMYATTTQVAKALIADTGIDIIVTSGTVLENLRTTSLNINNGMQLTRDSYHMDYGISRYAAACAVFETLITPCTGKKPSDSTHRYTNANTTNGSYSTPVTDANAPIAQRAAHEAVVNPFKITNLSSL